MNKIFKIVFNAARGKMMVVNEATSSVQTGKKATVTVAVIGALACVTNVAVANPQSVVLNGDTSIIEESKPWADNCIVPGEVLFVTDNDGTREIPKGSDLSYLHVDLGGYNLTYNNGIRDEGRAKGSNGEHDPGSTGIYIHGDGNLTIVHNARMSNGDFSGVGLTGVGTIDITGKLSIDSTESSAIRFTGTKTDGVADKLTVNADKVTLKAKGGVNSVNVIQFDSVTGGELVFGSPKDRIGTMKIDASEAERPIRITGEGNFVKIFADELNIIRSEALPGESIKADGNSSVIIDALSGVIDSDIEAGSTGTIDVKLGGDASFTGKFITNAKAKDSALTLNGASWDANADSDVNTLTLNNGYLTINGGADGATVKVLKGLAGDLGTVALGSEADKFEYVGDAANNTLSSVKVTLADQTADTVTADEAKALLDNVSGVDNVEAFVAEGEVAGAIVVGTNGKAVQAVNKKTEAIAEQVTLAPQMVTRIMMNDVRKRMGDLRAAEGTHGVWARYNGGQMSGQGMDADFHMVQVGIDTVPVADAPRFGVAFSYAQTEAEDNAGLATTDMDSFSLAFYGTKMYDSGMFVDVIGRMATMNTEMKLQDNEAKMDNVALSLSAELGWRFDVTDRFFFEPSVEATYTYTNAETFTMRRGTYELEAVDSLVGRAGFAAGFKCPSGFGEAYVRAAVVHEFMGDSTMNSWTATGNQVAPVVMDGKDTWFEYAIGANFNVNKNTYVYADVERTSGANVDEDWRANVGVRYAF